MYPSFLGMLGGQYVQRLKFRHHVVRFSVSHWGRVVSQTPKDPVWMFWSGKFRDICLEYCTPGLRKKDQRLFRIGFVGCCEDSSQSCEIIMALGFKLLRLRHCARKLRFPGLQKLLTPSHTWNPSSSAHCYAEDTSSQTPSRI